MLTVKFLKAGAVKRGCLKKGEIVDIDKAANIIIDEFRAGKLGRISLERP